MRGSRAFRRMQLPLALLRRRAHEIERAQFTDLYATLIQANQAMLRAGSETDLFQEICRICVDFGHFGLAWIAIQKDGRPCTVAAAGPMKDYLDGLEVSLDPDHPLGQGPTGRAFRGERCVLSGNWTEDPVMAPWRERGAPFGIRSSGSFPVRTQAGVEAVLTLYSDRGGAFEKGKIDLLEELTGDMAFALEKFREERRRRLAEEQLQEERNLYQDLVTTQPAGIYRLRVRPVDTVRPGDWESVHRSHYQVEFASDRFCEIAGLCREALLAVPGSLVDRIHPEDRQDFSRRNAEALSWMTPFRWEGRLVDQGRGLRWIRFESSPRALPDGGSLWTGVLTDTTERRTTSNDYRRVYSLLRQAESIAKVGGWEIDLDANTLYWSEEVFRIHELDPKSYRPTVEGSIEFYAPEWRPIISRAVQRAIETGENFDLDLELLTATGRRLWVHATSQVVWLDGRVVKVQGAFRDIAEERLAAEALAKSHAVLSGMMESSEGPIFSLDRDYCYTTFNQAHAATMKALYGTDITLGSCLFDHQPVPEDRAAAKVNLDRALAGESFTEERMSGSEGQARRSFEVSHTPIRKVDGQVIGVAIMARDTTERRKMEESLRASEDKNQALIRAIPDLVFTNDLDGEYLDAHVSDPNLLYLSPEAFLHRRLDEVLPGPLASRYLAAYRKAIDTRTVQELEYMLPVHGEEKWFEARVSPCTEDTVITIVRDITERHLTEAALRESEQRYRILFANNHAIKMLIDSSDGRIVDVNPAAIRFYGWTLEQFLGMNIGQINTATPEELQQSIRGAVSSHQDHFEFVHRLADGSLRNVDVYSGPITVEGRTLLYSIIHDTTDRVRALEANARLLHILESSLNEIYIFSPESLCFEYVNRAALENLGYASEAMATMSPLDLKPEFTEADFRKTLAPLLRREQKMASFETMHRRMDGTLYPVEVHIQLAGPQGQEVFLAVVVDISERRAAEAALRARVDQLQIMLELASLPDTHSGKELLREGLERIVQISGSRVGFLHLLLEDQETLELTAWTAETMKHCTASFDTHYPGAMAGIWADAVRLRRPVIHNDYPERTDRKGMPEGHFPLTREVVVPIVEAGKVRMIVGVGNKPTEYDGLDVGQLEVVAGDLWKGYARQLALGELKSSETSLRATFDQALVGIVHMDFAGRISRANQRFGDILGFDLHDLIDTDIARITHPEDQLPAGVMFQDILRNMGGSLIQEKRYLASGGTIVWVQLLSSLVSPTENEPGYILKVVEDITDRKRLEAEVQEMNRELERRVEQRTHQLEVANQELEAFSYSVSHDLRAPLRAISGFSEALKLDADSQISPAGLAHLQRVQGGAVRMGQLIEDLLHLSRVGKDDFLMIPMDLAVLADQVLAGLRGSNPGRQVTCQVEHPLRVHGDPRLLRILLENLLGNAWKFTSRAPEASITVTSRSLQAGQIEISICDNGVGFPSTQAGKLFTPFHRLHKQDEFPGTGIGLAIAKRIVSRHGGVIRAAGEEGRGAVVHFTLPLGKQERP